MRVVFKMPVCIFCLIKYRYPIAPCTYPYIPFAVFTHTQYIVPADAVIIILAMPENSKIAGNRDQTNSGRRHRFQSIYFFWSLHIYTRPYY